MLAQLGSVHAQQPSRPVMATVSVVKGQVTATGNTNAVLAAGDQLRPGAVIKTSADGGALLRPAPNIKVAVLASSEGRFGGSTVGAGGGGAEFELLEGNLFCRVTSPGNSNAPFEMKIATSNGLVSSKNGQYLLNQSKDRTMVADAQGDVNVRIGEGGGTVELKPGNVIWLQPGQQGRLEVKLVDLTTGTMVEIFADGSRGTPGIADPALLAASANQMAKVLALMVIEAGGGVSPEINNLIQAINRVVPGFSPTIGPSTPADPGQQVLNPDFVGPLPSNQPPDTTRPLPPGDRRPVASPDSP